MCRTTHVCTECEVSVYGTQKLCTKYWRKRFLIWINRRSPFTKSENDHLLNLNRENRNWPIRFYFSSLPAGKWEPIKWKWIWQCVRQTCCAWSVFWPSNLIHLIYEGTWFSHSNPCKVVALMRLVQISRFCSRMKCRVELIH